MKLSFVIPAYNEEKMIGQCLRSILAVTAGKNYDIEIIVVNNASTDRTREIALVFSGVRVIDEPEKGLVKARAAGYNASSGDLIANIDADTELTPGWIDKVFAEFEQDNKLVVLSGPFIYHDLSVIERLLVRLFYYFGYIVYLFNRFVLRISSMVQGGNFIVRRSALELIGGYNKNFDFYGEDTDIACRLNKVGAVKFTFALPIYASGRRLQKEGILKMGFRYSLNYFWTVFLKKPFSKEFIDVRK